MRVDPIEPICVKNLLTLAKVYSGHTGRSLPTVGRYFHGTTGYFEKLEAGDVCPSLEKYDAMVAKFKAEWPEDLALPKIREPFRAAR